MKKKKTKREFLAEFEQIGKTNRLRNYNSYQGIIKDCVNAFGDHPFANAMGAALNSLLEDAFKYWEIRDRKYDEKEASRQYQEQFVKHIS